VTYTGTGGFVPVYAPSANGPGTLSYVKLSGSAVAPLGGVVSADNTTFFAGTSGDNLVHLIKSSTLTDSSTLAPNLTNPAGTTVPVDFLVQKPRKTT
jgi:trimeric autotransporter adhesin